MLVVRLEAGVRDVVSSERETLFVGGTIRTVTPAERAEALLVRGRHIAYVGTEDGARQAARSEPHVVDLAGSAVLPGFVDAHCHPLMYGQFASWVDCSWDNAPDIGAVVARLSARAAQRPYGAVRGRGFHHGNVADQRLLTRHDLDQVATDREVLVFHSSGHGAIVNSFALRQAGVDATTPDPHGGHFGREADGTPNGEVWDAAADQLTGPGGVKIANNGPNFHLGEEPDALVAHLRTAQQELHRVGITTAVDAQVTARELLTYLRLRSQGGMTMRVEMLMISSLLPHLEALGIGGRLGDDMLALAGVKLYVDGALTGATARFKEPYCCDPSDFGYLYHDTAEFRDMLGRVHRLGLQSATHAQGDEAIEILLDAHEALADERTLDARYRIEHFGSATPEQVRRAGLLNLWAITQPQYVRRYGDELIRALGDRGHRTTPLGECLTEGPRFALSSDAPVCPPGPLEALHAAVTRRTLSGQVLGDEKLRISMADAVKAHTLDAAESIHREHAIGSLEPNKLADLVILSADPYEIDPDALLTTTVQQTWVDGVVVHQSEGVSNDG
jgi:predicted amidohydrolase YtcJ